MTGLPTIIHLHFQYDPKPAFLNRMLASHTAMAIGVSGVLRRHAVEAFGVPDEHAHTVYSCIDVERFTQVEAGARVRVRQELGIADEQVAVIVAGRVTLTPDKGQHIAVRAMAELRKTHPGAVLFVVGDGPDLESCKQLAAELQLEDIVRFTGQRSDMPDVFSAMDIAAVPSNNPDAFPYAATEPMCMGIPVVGTQIGGIPEMLDDGNRGVLVEPGNGEALASGLGQVIEDPDGTAQRARLAQEFALSLTIDRHADQLVSLYEAVLSR